jgi:hypothetical protein
MNLTAFESSEKLWRFHDTLLFPFMILPLAQSRTSAIESRT